MERRKLLKEYQKESRDFHPRIEHMNFLEEGGPRGSRERSIGKYSLRLHAPGKCLGGHSRERGELAGGVVYYITEKEQSDGKGRTERANISW